MSGLSYTIAQRVDFATGADAMEASERTRNWSYDHYVDQHWAGCSRSEALRRGREGDIGLAEASAAIMAKLHLPDVATHRKANVWDVAGYRPDVPRVLAGADPRVMRRRVRQDDARAPLRIYVDVLCSGGVGERQYMQRGACVLALVRVLAGQRPLELYACGFAPQRCGNIPGNVRANLWTVRLPTAPLDLPMVAGWIAHQGVFRAAMLGQSYDKAGGNAYPVEEECQPAVREALALAPRDLYLCGAFLGSELLTDPIGWIERTLRDLAATEED